VYFLCVLMYFFFVFFFFFFQAEDGIRDRTVTGVQTCALPISLAQRFVGHRADELFHPAILLARARGLDAQVVADVLRDLLAIERSEERRVGKECRSGWARDHEKKKR